MDQVTILVVEDDPSHVGLIKAVFRSRFSEARIYVESTCLGVKNYLRGAWGAYEDGVDFHPLPTLIVLDLWLVDSKAFEILEWMAEREWLAKIPVVMFTASKDPTDVMRAKALGVRRYLCKPDDYGNLVQAVRDELRPAVELDVDSASA